MMIADGRDRRGRPKSTVVNGPDFPAEVDAETKAWLDQLAADVLD